MTASNHVLTGMVVGSVLGVPVLSLPVAFLSHFILDSLPHYDTGDKDHTTRKFLYVLTVDTAVAASIVLSTFLLQPVGWPLIVAAGIVAASPDLMWLPRWLNEIRGKENRPLGRLASFHSRIQKLSKPDNWPWEVVWFGAMIAVLTKLAF